DPGDLGGGQRLRAAVHRPARRAHAARAVEGDADDDPVGAGAAAASHAEAALAAEVIEPAALVVGEGAGAATGAAVGGHLQPPHPLPVVERLEGARRAVRLPPSLAARPVLPRALDRPRRRLGVLEPALVS